MNCGEQETTSYTGRSPLSLPPPRGEVALHLHEPYSAYHCALSLPQCRRSDFDVRLIRRVALLGAILLSGLLSKPPISALSCPPLLDSSACRSWFLSIIHLFRNECLMPLTRARACSRSGSVLLASFSFRWLPDVRRSLSSVPWSFWVMLNSPRRPVRPRFRSLRRLALSGVRSCGRRHIPSVLSCYSPRRIDVTSGSLPPFSVVSSRPVTGYRAQCNSWIL